MAAFLGPPSEALFIHRKVGGLYLSLSKLRGRGFESAVQSFTVIFLLVFLVPEKRRFGHCYLPLVFLE